MSNLLTGKVRLTSEVALRLERVLGTPKSFWSNLEMIYRDKLSRIKDEINQE